jgi:hypothetical protein
MKTKLAIFSLGIALTGVNVVQAQSVSPSPTAVTYFRHLNRHSKVLSERHTRTRNLTRYQS